VQLARDVARALEGAVQTGDHRAVAEALVRRLGERTPELRLVDAVTASDGASGAVAVLVVVERAARGLPSGERLSRRFGLSPREAQVALLLAERRSNSEIAGALGISPHTAKRHTERVLGKLGVSTRRAVGTVVCVDTPEPERVAS
jgi:DNA-binding CsgD family transcriptional regulator